MDPNRIFTGILILLLCAMAFCMKPAHATTEYLQYDNTSIGKQAPKLL